MSMNRWKYIQSILHFVDKKHLNSRDKFAKIRPAFEIFANAFESSFNVGQIVSIDEQLVLWKGHHSLERYIP
jgi:hypothetical protein